MTDGRRYYPAAPTYTQRQDYGRGETAAMHDAASQVAADNPDGFAFREAYEAAFLAEVERVGGPPLREYAEWVLETRPEDAALDELAERDPEALTAHVVEAVATLRLLNAHREIEQMGQVLEHDSLHAPSRARVQELLAYVGQVGRQYPRANQHALAALERERDLPARMPLAMMRARRGRTP